MHNAYRNFETENKEMEQNYMVLENQYLIDRIIILW